MKTDFTQDTVTVAKITPVYSLKKALQSQEQRFPRFLNDEKIQRLWSMLNEYPNQNFSNVIRLLLLTGSKHSEIINAKWDQFNLEEGIWIKPSNKTKRKLDVVIPLSSQAIANLKDMKKISDSDFLFPEMASGKLRQEFKKAWITICEQAGLTGFRLSGLRETYASHLVSSGQSLYRIGKLLGKRVPSSMILLVNLSIEQLRQTTHSDRLSLRKEKKRNDIILETFQLNPEGSTPSW